MNAQSYIDIAARIRAKVPVCRSIDIYNAQYEEPNKHQPLKYPCVLIEWLPTNWESLGNNAQQGDGGFRIHCVVNSMNSTYDLDTKTLTQQGLSLQHLQFQRQVHDALQDFAPTDYTGLQRTRTVPDHRYTSVLVFIHEYSAGEIYRATDPNTVMHPVEDFPTTGEIVL